MARTFTLLVLALAARTSWAQPAPDLVLEGAVPASGEFFELPFEVPAGTVEIQIAHAATDADDILDFGVLSPEGFRGYGGGNTEDAVIGVEASSRSYLPGPIAPGTWTLYVGKAKVRSAAPGYAAAITFRTTATLPPATDRAPYAEAAPLSSEARFYAGDFHVHSEDSGDARPPLAEIAAFARGRGLDFVVITDHNTVAQDERIAAAQPAHPELLFVPGIELTTYAGHATAFGATAWVDHRVGFGGQTLQAAVDDIVAQGGLLSINHPALDLGDACIGCAWAHEAPALGTLHGVEIETGGWRQAGRLFAWDAIALWEQLLDQGHHLAALGGSDDHQAGQGNSSPIADPTTLVFASGLSVSALRQGILDSRTVVKMQGPDDPMIALDTTPARVGDTVAAAEVTLTATVSGGVGSQFRFVQSGLGVAPPVEVTDDPQTFTLLVTPSEGGAERVRAEVQVDDAGELVPRTITSYVWLLPAPPAACACAVSGRSALPLASAALLLWLALAAARARCGARAAHQWRRGTAPAPRSRRP
ncbi:MAG: PHP domain-containing protein [Deltaproteobacteria bacterium]|nr:PHP domain-containing protein [Deltaproteobacteria bacterium]